MEKYLVTGGCGFIGSHLVEELVHLGHEVIIIDNLSSERKDTFPEKCQKKIEFVTADINDEAILEDVLAKVDGCFHIAAIASIAETINNWTSTHLVNQTGLVRIFEKISKLKRKIPVVFASSAAVYGDNPNFPLKETEIPNPLSPYGVDKLACEYNAKIANHIYNIPTIGLRFFNVYGPKQDRGVISRFIKSIQLGKNIEIYGDGEDVRDFIYVLDVVAAIILSMEFLHKESSQHINEIYNVCSGKGISLLAMIEVLEEILAVDAKVNFLPERNGNIKKSIGNASKINHHLNFIPKYNFKDGLKKIVDYRLNQEK